MEQSSTMTCRAETCQDSGKTDIICYSIFIPQELVHPLPSPWPAEHPPSSLMLAPSGAFHPGRDAPQHAQAEGEGENIFIWPHLLLLPG